MNRDVLVLREVVVKLTQLLAGMSLQVTQRGMRAYVATCPKTLKPKRVNIPHIPDNASPELILAIQGFIDHEVGHILHTDFKWNKKAQDLGERIRGYWNLLEDTFIERKQVETFKGAGWNLAKLHEFFIREITAPALKLAEDKGDAASMFGILMVPIARAWSGQRIFQDYLDSINAWSNPAIKDKIDRMRPIQAKIPKLKSSEDCYNLALELADLLKAQKKPAPPPPKDDELDAEPEEGEPNGGKGETPEDEGEGPADDTINSPPEEKRKPEPGDDEDDGDVGAGEDDEDGQFEKGSDGKDPLNDLERRVLTARIDHAKSFEDIARKAKRPADEIEQIYDKAITKLKNGFGEAA